MGAGLRPRGVQGRCVVNTGEVRMLRDDYGDGAGTVAKSRGTLYIAGPMSGLPEHNYPAFNAAAQMLRGFGYGVLNPVHSERHNPTPGTPQPWDWYMRHALRMICDADALALLPGWQRSRGATFEVHVAHVLGMEAHPLETWVERAS